MATFASNSIASAMTPRLGITVSEKLAPLAADQPILAHLYFGDKNNLDKNCLSIQTNLEALDSDLFAQYWFTDREVKQTQYKNLHYAYNQQILFGHIQLPCSSTKDFQQLTEQAYREIYECLRSTGCRYLLRTWNFFPAITKICVEHSQTTRYELFCSGRLHAMQTSGIDTKTYPAATVIGNQSRYLQIYFLASDVPGIAVENPRQTSAYNYPLTDTFTRPLFSRGVLKAWGDCTHFYVSGTASIVGYETLHINDVGAQLNEAINNIETLVAHTNDQHQTQLNAQDDLLYMKVYIRHSENVAHINKVLAARLSNTTPRILLLGDMCRDNLLVEIEAFYQA